MLEIIKNSTLTNNKRERDVTKNGKSFLVPWSKVQASSREESKGIGVQSPSVQSSRVQESRPYAQSPAISGCLFKHCH